jgi:hypothetical protein
MRSVREYDLSGNCWKIQINILRISSKRWRITNTKQDSISTGALEWLTPYPHFAKIILIGSNIT